jgi:curved DNA-binding protein CbpA
MPSASLPPELLERWTEIVERSQTVDRENYFTMLDVDREATTEQVQQAFFGLAKKWHPDRLHTELAPVRELCSRVFARMSEAHATLTDPTRRENYMRLLAEGGATPEAQETIALVVEAATNFQKAEICLRRNDFAQAEELCRKAHEGDPQQPDYMALLAWLTSMKPDKQGPEATIDCIRMLDEATKLSAKCEKAFFYRAMLYKKLGKGELANRDFKRAAELNPRNIDAAREVRLYNMRNTGGGTKREKDSGPPALRSSPTPAKPEPQQKSGGLFGKLFKKS